MELKNGKAETGNRKPDAGDPQPAGAGACLVKSARVFAREMPLVAYQGVIGTAVREARFLCDHYAGECRLRNEEPALARNPVPHAVRETLDAVGRALRGTEYENVFEAIRNLVLEERLYARGAGETLLLELVYGRRHLDFCDPEDLGHLEWEAWDVEGHLGRDPVYRAFWPHGMRALNEDNTAPCHTFMNALLRQFLALELEFAAMNAVKWMVPRPHDLPPEKNAARARLFGEALEYAGERKLPMFWDLAYEHAGGMKDWPKNPAFFDAARRNAETQLQAIRDGLAAAGDPLTWLRENASCVFVGANDLAALAGFLYHDARDAADAGLRAAAADTLRLLGRDNALLEKMMRKRGIPKEVLR